MNLIRYAVWLMLFFIPVAGLTTPETPRQEIVLCDFRVPAEISRANASFTVVYTAKIGNDGRVISVEKVKNDFLPSKPFSACVGKWILPASNQKVVITFAWQHGVGWTEITISGQGIDTRIRVRAGACKQY